jgi:hypothetical protein
MQRLQQRRGAFPDRAGRGRDVRDFDDNLPIR